MIIHQSSTTSAKVQNGPNYFIIENIIHIKTNKDIDIFIIEVC